MRIASWCGRGQCGGVADNTDTRQGDRNTSGNIVSALLISLAIGLPFCLAGKAFAESSGSHAAAHPQGSGKTDTETSECYAQIKRHPYKALLCYETVDVSLKILLKRDTDGNAIYKNLLKACGYDYVSGVVNAKELSICRKKLTVLEKFDTSP